MSIPITGTTITRIIAGTSIRTVLIITAVTLMAMVLTMATTRARARASAACW
jgi:hypothetical protein